jgi:DNA-binding NarL/FixJ family response regulator
MNVVVLTPLRLLGDGLAACFERRPEIATVTVANDLGSLRDSLAAAPAHAVLIDVTQGLDLWDVRGIAVEWPDVALVALGLTEQRQDVINCGRAGYAGYVRRDASIDALCKTLGDIVAGRLACPPEIVSGLMRALFHREPHTNGTEPMPDLTRRESEVLELLGRGLSNKEIASNLCVSVATVKHHVHHVLEKMQLSKRAEAMRRVRDAPWLGRNSTPTSRR